MFPFGDEAREVDKSCLCTRGFYLITGNNRLLRVTGAFPVVFPHYVYVNSVVYYVYIFYVESFKQGHSMDIKYLDSNLDVAKKAKSIKDIKATARNSN